jgi:Zn-dependent metalloprotease
VKRQKGVTGDLLLSRLIGGDLLVQTPTRRALRSFAAPGTAYKNDPDLGTDPQPAHMKNKYTGEDDNGGVHINSGIPNHAFYLAARKIGGRAWEKTGKIWYGALRALSPKSGFREAAIATTEKAAALYGRAEAAAVKAAWSAVGISR